MLENAAPTAHLLDGTRGAVVLITAVKASEKTPRTTRRVRHDRMRAVVQPRVSGFVPAVHAVHLGVTTQLIHVESRDGDHAGLRTERAARVRPRPRCTRYI